jgi:bacterioferritin
MDQRQTDCQLGDSPRRSSAQRQVVTLVIKGVIKAEQNAITQFDKVIKLCEQRDYVTQELAIQILGNEQDHHREFVGFLKEYKRESLL